MFGLILMFIGLVAFTVVLSGSIVLDLLATAQILDELDEILERLENEG